MKLNWTTVRVLDLDLLTTWSNLNFVSKAGAACLEGGNHRVEILDVKHGVHPASGASLSSRARLEGGEAGHVRRSRKRRPRAVPGEIQGARCRTRWPGRRRAPGSEQQPSSCPLKTAPTACWLTRVEAFPSSCSDAGYARRADAVLEKFDLGSYGKATWSLTRTFRRRRNSSGENPVNSAQ